jgi:hypothetical protein
MIPSVDSTVPAGSRLPPSGRQTERSHYEFRSLNNRLRCQSACFCAAKTCNNSVIHRPLDGGKATSCCRCCCAPWLVSSNSIRQVINTILSKCYTCNIIYFGACDSAPREDPLRTRGWSAAHARSHRARRPGPTPLHVLFRYPGRLLCGVVALHERFSQGSTANERLQIHRGPDDGDSDAGILRLQRRRCRARSRPRRRASRSSRRPSRSSRRPSRSRGRAPRPAPGRPSLRPRPRRPLRRQVPLNASNCRPERTAAPRTSCSANPP